jgi:hypothetical protein
MDDLVEGLASLGQSRSSARAIVEEAFLELHEPSDEDVLRYALQNPATRST